jgi:DNA-binding CsgD family transcriptional regulator
VSIVLTPESDRARFWAKVDKNGPVPEHCPDIGPCWCWLGALAYNGYGFFRVNKKQRRAHVVSFEWHVGPVPEGLSVLHHCDVRRCVRPDHLFTGTQKDNIQDAVSKGRMATGKRSGMYTQDLTILTEDQVREIHALYENGMYQQEIADQIGISQTMVSHILLGKAWGHLGLAVKPNRGKPRPSDDIIRSIRAMVATGISYRETGRAHGYSASAVWRIATRAAYPDVE